MTKNDYRRAFIMLRTAAQGYGGHARLERRTLTGSLYFIVTAPEGAGPLAAALVGRKDGTYYAASLGEFARDRRGQLTLAKPFDPRAIDGRPLEAYDWVAVADLGGNCRVVLTGNVNGSKEVDPAALERAVCARLGAADGSESNQTPAADVSQGADPLPAADLPEPGEGEPADSDVKIYRSARARAAEAMPANAEDAAAAEEAPPEPAPEPAALPGPEALLGEVAASEDATPQTAAQVLRLDITRPWPEVAEPLRRLFATQVPANAPLSGDYVYVATAMPQGSGLGDCLVGLKAEDGRITGIRYALPGSYAPEPPTGLEDYRWDDAGHWVLDIGIS